MANINSLINRIERLSQTDAEKQLSSYVLVELDGELTEDKFRKAGEIYGAILYAILFPQDTWYYDTYFDYKTRKILAENNIDNLLLFNELLHYIHVLYPDARNEGVGAVALLRNVKFNEGGKLNVTFIKRYTNFGEFPDDLRKRVEKILKPIRDDISITYTTTWMYSHIDFGDDYVYKPNEHPKLEIRFLVRDEIEVVKSLLLTEFKADELSFFEVD